MILTYVVDSVNIFRAHFLLFLLIHRAKSIPSTNCFNTFPVRHFPEMFGRIFCSLLRARFSLSCSCFGSARALLVLCWSACISSSYFLFLRAFLILVWSAAHFSCSFFSARICRSCLVRCAQFSFFLAKVHRAFLVLG